MALPLADNIADHNQSEQSSWECSFDDLPPPVQDYPIEPTTVYIIDAFYLISNKFLDSKELLYSKALKALAEGSLKEAKDFLVELVNTYQDFSYGHIQLGFVEMWIGHPYAAERIFKDVLKHCPCNEYTLRGLTQLATQYEREEQMQDSSLELFRLLNSCVPDSSEYLFGVGRTLARTGNWAEAEEILIKCLELSPADSDIALQLASVYYRQGNWDKAKALYEKYPDRVESQEGLARVYLAQGDDANAKTYLDQVIAKDSKNPYALQNLARLYAKDLYFTESKRLYEILTEKFKNDDSAFRELFDVKLHTQPVVNYNVSYVEAKENDPSIKKPVVLDSYFNNDITVYVPIYDRWRLDVRTFFDYQKEKNILPTNPGINYNAQIAGAALFSHVFFAKYWRWDLFSDVKWAWNVGKNVYPFQNTTRVEPGSYISYNTDQHRLSIGGNVDSYVIKNFSKITSSLLTLRSLGFSYTYTAPVWLRPEFEVSFDETYVIFQPKNRRDTETGSFRFLVPYLEDYFKLFYTFEHRHFRRLNVNYYSFFEQWRNTFGFNFFLRDLHPSLTFDLIYWHRTQGTKDLFQPIGDFVYIAPWQFLKCNQVQASFGYRLKDVFKMDLSGGYYRDTLPYRAWNVAGHLSYIF